MGSLLYELSSMKFINTFEQSEEETKKEFDETYEKIHQAFKDIED